MSARSNSSSHLLTIPATGSAVTGNAKKIGEVGMNTEPELLNERLERLATVLDEIMPQCALLVRDALAMLKEQEAKQIVRKQCKKEYDDGSIEYFAEWYCPHCNSLILRGFDNPSIKFCYKCGKPVLWEGR